MLLSAVFLLSMSALALEVLLTRVFSISQWNHLSSMVISLALFGFAASGTLLTLLDARGKVSGGVIPSRRWVRGIIVFYSLGAVAAFGILNRLPFDYFRLPLERMQVFYLLAAYLLLSLPFFCAGLMLAVAYTRFPEQSGRIYAASMIGSTCGALLPGALLPWLGEGQLVILMALCPLVWIPGVWAKPEPSRPRGRIRRSKPGIVALAALGGGTIAFLLLSPAGERLARVRPSAYKALSQVLLRPDSKIYHSRNHIRGRIDQVQSPYIRFAPGLSLKATADLPVQSAVFKDGDGQIALYHLSEPGQASFAQSSLSYAGYLLVGTGGRVLVIEQEGGIAIPCALASLPGELTVLAQHPEIAKILRQHYRLQVVSRNPRSFLAADPSKFDVIHLENWGSSLPGADALSQTHLLNREAFGVYLDHLADGGVLILSRRLLLPPTDAIRLWGTAYESLRARAVRTPERHLALLRSWDTFTLVVSPQPLTEAHRLEAFASRLNFDLVYLPEMRMESANRFNRFAQPYYALEISRLLAAYREGTEKQFYATDVCDVKPQSDWRPFPARFLKWTRFKALYTTLGSRPYSLLLSGETVLVVLLAEALAMAAGLLVLPLLTRSGRNHKRSRSNHLFFLAIGCGYMFVELYFIHAFTLLFGDPVVSLMVVLPAVLAFSGAGGLWSHRLALENLKKTLGLLAALLLVLLGTTGSLLRWLLGVSPPFQLLGALLIMVGPGVVMGLPFPCGMRRLAPAPGQRAYAWAMNGCASVVSAIAALQVAISQGIPLILAGALGMYLLAWASLAGRSGR